MMKPDLQTFVSPSQQQKLLIFQDVLEYIFVIIISLSAIFAALISFQINLSPVLKVSS